MLKLDGYSESILFQCDWCQRAGELFTEVVEDEGLFYCWGCLGEMKSQKEKKKEVNQRSYAH